MGAKSRVRRIRNNGLKQKSRIVNRDYIIAQRYPESSIGIRMGGRHSRNLYWFLSPRCKRKIRCFIDSNPNCDCMMCQLPVVPLAQAMEMGLGAIILSSRDHLEMLRYEAAAYPQSIDVLDIYDCLEQNEIFCSGTFYSGGEYYAGVCDVGYPYFS